MKEKKGFGDQLEAFVEGKGFYIGLFLCAAVIGVSAWTLMVGTDVDDRISEVGVAGVVVTPEAENTPAPSTAPESAKPQTTPAPAPTEAMSPDDGESAQVWSENSPALFVWPVNGDIVTPYSVDKLLYDQTMQDWRAHSGIDISAPIGTYVLAVSEGEVSAIEDDEMYGTTVVIAHPSGVESVYSGLAAQPTVAVGDSVKAGDVIGAVGDTAMCESALGAHLHFVMREDGKNIDPQEYLP